MASRLDETLLSSGSESVRRHLWRVAKKQKLHGILRRVTDPTSLTSEDIDDIIIGCHDFNLVYLLCAHYVDIRLSRHLTGTATSQELVQFRDTTNTLFATEQGCSAE